MALRVDNTSSANCQNKADAFLPAYLDALLHKDNLGLGWTPDSSKIQHRLLSAT